MENSGESQKGIILAEVRRICRLANTIVRSTDPLSRDSVSNFVYEMARGSISHLVGFDARHSLEDLRTAVHYESAIQLLDEEISAAKI